jgi:hypothetical protein
LRRGYSELAARLVGSVVLFGIGAWPIVTQEARFRLGGRTGSPNRGIHVDAVGLDAVVIGCVFVGLAIVNLALGLRSPARLKVFWAGAGLLGATLLFGTFRALQAVASLFGS